MHQEALDPECPILCGLCWSPKGGGQESPFNPSLSALLTPLLWTQTDMARQEKNTQGQLVTQVA